MPQRVKRSSSASGRFLQNTELFKRINLIWPVQSHLQKQFGIRFAQITLRTRAVSSHQEGRLAIVTNAGRDAMDADVPLTNGA